mmetsp:Transcript_27714/g.50067  ORF Transcript_27714/g.50067 Transcript_27714/m.50067 type:complete len:225 (-) Transcript_27714:542-1216(-)
MCDMKRSSSNMVMTLEMFFTHRSNLAWLASWIKAGSSAEMESSLLGASSEQKTATRSRTASEISWPRPGKTSSRMPLSRGSSMDFCTLLKGSFSSTSPWIARQGTFAGREHGTRPLSMTTALGSSASADFCRAFKLCPTSMAPWLNPPMTSFAWKRAPSHRTVATSRCMSSCGAVKSDSSPKGHHARIPVAASIKVRASGRATAVAGSILWRTSASAKRSSPRT